MSDDEGPAFTSRQSILLTAAQVAEIPKQKLPYWPSDRNGNLLNDAGRTGGEIAVWFEDGQSEGHLRCPWCGHDDTIQEQDRAIRWNAMWVERSDDGELSLTASTSGEYDWEQDAEVGFFCENCYANLLELPDPPGEIGAYT